MPADPDLLSAPAAGAPAASRRDLLMAGAGIAVASVAAPAAAAEKVPTGGGAQTCCPIVEMRQYTVHTGTRDRFIALFEREFVESQEAVGARLIGHFRDMDDPERFVWFRGFPDMPGRAAALNAFYFGDLWKSKRDEANASINDSDNVLLLRPASPGSGFATSRLRRPPRGRPVPKAGVVLANLHYVDADMVQTFADFFEARMRPKIEALGVPVIAQFATEASANNFPRLPVREKDHVFLWFSAFPNVAACDRAIAQLRNGQSWREGASDPILHQLERKPEMLRLAPGDRSALRG
jgi:hypothetical protein